MTSTTIKADIIEEVINSFTAITDDGQITCVWASKELKDQAREKIESLLSTQRNEILARLPKATTYQEATNIADHWGMTETSIARQIDNMKSLGYNQALTEVRQLIEGLDK